LYRPRLLRCRYLHLVGRCPALTDEDHDHDGIPRHGSRSPKVVLISLDGAKPDFIDRYLELGVLPRDGGLARVSRGVIARQNVTANPSLTAVSHIAIATGSTAVHNDIPSNTFQAVAAPITSSVSGFAAAIGGYQITPAGALAKSDRRALVGQAAPARQEGGRGDVARRGRRRYRDQRCRGSAGTADPRHRLCGAVRCIRRAGRRRILHELSQLRCRRRGDGPAATGWPLLVQPDPCNGSLRDLLLLVGSPGHLHNSRDARSQIRNARCRPRHHQ